MTILRRSRALGDLIQATPLIRDLISSENSLTVVTCRPDLLTSFPGALLTSTAGARQFGMDERVAMMNINELLRSAGESMFIDLDGVWPNEDETWTESFYRQAGMGRPSDHRYVLGWSADERDAVAALSIPHDRIAVHLPMRPWIDSASVKWFENLVKEASKMTGLPTVCVGFGSDVEIECDLSVFGKLGVKELALAVSESRAIVCEDSYPMHCAGLSRMTKVFAVFSRPWAHPMRHLPKSNDCFGIWIDSRCKSFEPIGAKTLHSMAPEHGAEMIKALLDGSMKGRAWERSSISV